MKKIPISFVKRVREDLAATHIVIFAVSEDGTQQVATHGESRLHAREAADAGNRLKFALKWPPELCRDTPLPRICKNCIYYKPDYGTHCFNGWSQDGSQGHCRLEPTHVPTEARSLCSHFEPA